MDGTDGRSFCAANIVDDRVAYADRVAHLAHNHGIPTCCRARQARALNTCQHPQQVPRVQGVNLGASSVPRQVVSGGEDGSATKAARISRAHPASPVPSVFVDRPVKTYA